MYMKKNIYVKMAQFGRAFWPAAWLHGATVQLKGVHVIISNLTFLYHVSAQAPSGPSKPAGDPLVARRRHRTSVSFNVVATFFLATISMYPHNEYRILTKAFSCRMRLRYNTHNKVQIAGQKKKCLNCTCLLVTYFPSKCSPVGGVANCRHFVVHFQLPCQVFLP